MDPMFFQRRKQAAMQAPLDGDDLFSLAAKDEARARELAAGQAAGEAQAQAKVAPAVLEQLVQLMEAIALRDGTVSVAELRTEALAAGLLKAEQPLDFLGTIARRSKKLVPVGLVRSHVRGTHGNRNVRYALRDDARGAA